MQLSKSISISHVVSLISETFLRPSRIPLSAFIVEDMVEFVHAHASYRFVMSDEEEERPRLLVSGGPTYP